VTRARILFVDDEALVLRALVRTVKDENFDVVLAASAAEARAILASETIDVVVSDLRMPYGDGASLLAFVKDRFPDAVRILLTGDPDCDASARVHYIIDKPWAFDDLKRTLRDAAALALRRRQRAG
jgi:DNA-binding NtrC family response regulator